jgi:hypothetical protein
VVDEHAIAVAIQTGLSGTARDDRGRGFEWVLRETLASAATAAEMRVRAGRGRFRRTIAGGFPRDEGGPAPSIVGTWLLHEWTTIVTA